jgi:toxin ParE1/3/4
MASWYGERGGRLLAEKFFDEARLALETVETMPSIGSPRLGLLIAQPSLRSWALEHFPVRWFYFERDDHLDVVRLLGERQDIAAILADALD